MQSLLEKYLTHGQIIYNVWNQYAVLYLNKFSLISLEKNTKRGSCLSEHEHYLKALPLIIVRFYVAMLLAEGMLRNLLRGGAENIFQ